MFYMNKKKIFSLIITTSFFLFFAFSLPTLADGILPGASGTSDCQTRYGNSATECGDYAVSDFLVLAIKVSQFIFGIIGSLTLLMFVYGGFMFLISAGSADKVGEARKIITAAVVGLLIVFGSWLIINFVFKAMGLNWQGKVEMPGQATSTISLLK